MTREETPPQTRGKALTERHAKKVEALLPHTNNMPPLKVRNSVRIQNQTGNAPRRWDKSDHDVEVRQNDPRVRQSNSLQSPINTAIRPAHRELSRAHAVSWMTSRTGPLTLGGGPYPYSPCTEDLTQKICTPLVSDARRPPCNDSDNVANATAHTNAPSRRTQNSQPEL